MIGETMHFGFSYLYDARDRLHICFGNGQKPSQDQKKPAGLLRRAREPMLYPSIRMVFFSGSFFASFLGISRLSTPFSYLALMSSSVMLPPT